MKDRKNKRRKQKTGRFDFTTFRSPVLRQFSNAGCFDYAQQSCIAHRSCASLAIDGSTGSPVLRSPRTPE